MNKDPLLQEFEIKNLVLRNRIMSTAHAPNYMEDGQPKGRYRKYHEEKAKGGLALSIVGGSSNVSLDSPSIWGQIDLSNDEVIPHLSGVANSIKQHGAAAMCQITHMGRRTINNDGNWLPVLGPSNKRERLHRAFPKAMEQHEIDRIIRDFALAASRCKQAGLDGIEVLAFGHLLGQFLTPSVNDRTDDYGGSLNNRIRFLIQVLEEVRASVGQDFIVGVRTAADELAPDGLTGSDCIEIAKILDDSELVDFLNLNVGQPFTENGLSLWMPGMGLGSAPHLELVGKVKQAIRLPVFHAGAINDLSTARYAIREGLLDMVGMTRAHITDPHIVNKIIQNEEDSIRPCVGSGLCVDRVGAGLDAICTHNVVTGREKFLSHSLSRSSNTTKKVVVVGGGPGGMEAARVCAEKNCVVTMFEASDRLGGQINLAAVPASRKQMQGITDWLQSELERLSVVVHYNTYAEKQDVLAESPDYVIIATGGIPNVDILSSGSEHLTSTWNVLSGDIKVSTSAVLYDDHGSHQGLSCAEYLARQGIDITFVTPDRSPGMELGHCNLPVYLKMLYALGVEFVVNQSIVSVATSSSGLGVHFKNEYSGQTTTLATQLLIVENGTIPVEDVYFDLLPYATNQGRWDNSAVITLEKQSLMRNKSIRFALNRIGDAVSSRDIHSAMYDAHRIATMIRR